MDTLPLQQAISLVNLPTEIIGQICAHLCRHCHGVKGDIQESHLALRALFKTCKKLMHIVRPFLLHILRPPKPFYSPDFLKVLATRPELAAQVRMLDQSVCIPFPRSRGGKDESDLAELIERMHMDASDNSDLSEEWDRLGLENNVINAWETRDRLDYTLSLNDGDFPELLSEVLVALLPKLETLFVFSGVYHSYRRNRRLASRFRSLVYTPGFPELRTLRLQAPTASSFRLFNPGNSVLMNAAPKLERLELVRCDALYCAFGELNRYHIRPNLHTIEFLKCELEDKGREHEYLQKLVELCPNLEHFGFSYRPLHPEVADKRYMASATMICSLKTSRQNIKSIDIDISASIPGEGGPSVEPSLDSTNLHLFSALEVLKVTDKAFSPCTEPQMGFHIPQRRQGLFMFLKPVSSTLRVLVVRMCHESEAWQEVIDLGNKVLAGEFPSLSRVEIRRVFTESTRAWRDEDENLSKKCDELVHNAFQGTGIRVLIPEPEFVLLSDR